MNQYRPADGVSLLSRSSRSSGCSRSSLASSSSSNGSYVTRDVRKSDNLAVRLAAHCLRGPMASANHRYQANIHYHDKKHGGHSSSSSSKSSQKHHRSSTPRSPSPEPVVWREHARPPPARPYSSSPPQPQPPPPPPGAPFVGPGQGPRPMFGRGGQGFGQVNRPMPTGMQDPVWGIRQPQGMRRGSPSPTVELVNE
ncbi:hypothetical protein SCAR479_03154 [Seiridium cardinale]|uniref:Uncharacterized protein n=1 Tax=Seiridium cardinale TaxID=138064 RepID=A0ABR2Y1T1_9PEZI